MHQKRVGNARPPHPLGATGVLPVYSGWLMCWARIHFRAKADGSVPRAQHVSLKINGISCNPSIWTRKDITTFDIRIFARRTMYIPCTYFTTTCNRAPETGGSRPLAKPLCAKALRNCLAACHTRIYARNAVHITSTQLITFTCTHNMYILHNYIYAAHNYLRRPLCSS